jgi:hypothetical protein
VCENDCYAHPVRIADMDDATFRALKCPVCTELLVDEKGHAKKVSGDGLPRWW